MRIQEDRSRRNGMCIDGLKNEVNQNKDLVQLLQSYLSIRAKSTF